MENLLVINRRTSRKINDISEDFEMLEPLKIEIDIELSIGHHYIKDGYAFEVKSKVYDLDVNRYIYTTSLVVEK